MSSNVDSYTTLKTHLKLAVTRLKLLQKKKTELTQKTRTNIVDFLTAGKPDRAKILVEHVIREDYLAEAMEMVEMYCDLLLVRFDILTRVKDLDDGLKEAVASLIWVTPRIQSDVPEIKVICDLLIMKFGRSLPDKSRLDISQQVSRKLQNKLSTKSPSKMMVEKYLIEIASSFNIEYKADQECLKDDNGSKESDNSLSSIQTIPIRPEGYPKNFHIPETSAFNDDVPTLNGEASSSLRQAYPHPSENNVYPLDSNTEDSNGDFPPPYSSISSNGTEHELTNSNTGQELPRLPSVPSHYPNPPWDDVIIDDIAKRFEALRKK